MVQTESLSHFRKSARRAREVLRRLSSLEITSRASFATNDGRSSQSQVRPAAALPHEGFLRSSWTVAHQPRRDRREKAGPPHFGSHRFGERSEGESRCPA